MSTYVDTCKLIKVQHLPSKYILITYSEVFGAIELGFRLSENHVEECQSISR